MHICGSGVWGLGFKLPYYGHIVHLFGFLVIGGRNENHAAVTYLSLPFCYMAQIHKLQIDDIPQHLSTASGNSDCKFFFGSQNKRGTRKGVICAHSTLNCKLSRAPFRGSELL